MEEKQLTEQELVELRELNTRYSTVISNLGECEIFITGLQDQLNRAQEEKTGFISDFKSFKAKSDELYTKLTEKYGSGRINLDTGKIETV